MIRVNCSELKLKIDSLEEQIDAYEETALNLFNALKNSCISWHDPRTESFEAKMLEEKQETDSIIRQLRTKKEILNAIYDGYKQYGDTVNCELENQEALITKVDACGMEVQNLLQLLRTLDIQEYQDIVDKVNTQRTAITTVSQEISQLKGGITGKYTTINGIENSISTRISEILDIQISEFNFNLITSNGYSSTSTVDIDALTQDIADIRQGMADESIAINGIYDSFVACAKEYNSSNSADLSNSILKIKNIANELLTKRKLYIKMLETIMEEYKATAVSSARDLNSRMVINGE